MLVFVHQYIYNQPGKFLGVINFFLSTDKKTKCYLRQNLLCAAGRCINSMLTCNRQNDCGDNSDERDCGDLKIVCPVEKRVAPGADLVGNG